MGIPLFIPSPSLLASWQISHIVLKELTWDLVFNGNVRQSSSSIPQSPGGLYPFDPNDQQNIHAIEYWVKFADFYVWPNVTTFESFDDMVKKVEGGVDLKAISASMKKENKRMNEELQDTWKKNFHRMFEGVRPASEGGGSPSKTLGRRG